MQAEEERPTPLQEEEISPERRSALAKLGKLASYVPPAMVILALSTRESAASFGDFGAPPDEPPPE